MFSYGAEKSRVHIIGNIVPGEFNDFRQQLNSKQLRKEKKLFASHSTLELAVNHVANFRAFRFPTGSGFPIEENRLAEGWKKKRKKIAAHTP